MDLNPSDLCVGTAAEHMVCADLLLAGYRAFRADQFCPYDVAVEHAGRLIRIQVKATRRPRAVPQRRKQTDAYLFHVKRAGKGGNRRYTDLDFDVVALVALDILRIAYYRIGRLRQAVHLIVPGQEHVTRLGKSFDSATFVSCLEVAP